MGLGINVVFLGSQTEKATSVLFWKKNRGINGFIEGAVMGKSMVKVQDPNTGEMIDLGEVVFYETGTQRHELESGDDILVVETKYWVKPAKPLYHRREWLEEEYVVKNRTMAEIAKQFGITPMSIHQWLGKHNIPTRSRGRRK